MAAAPEKRDAPEASGPPRVAVLTVARDEAVMLPRWVAHYGREFGVENLIVFDDNSSDGSTDDLPCTVHRIPGFRGGFEGHRLRLVSGVAKGLLETYDWVVFTDVDEFLLADPARHGGLVDLLAARSEAPILASLAFNVVHHVESEEPLDPAAPVLGQRRLASFAPVMCKPSVKQVSAPWSHASHGTRVPYAVDPELFMVHLKFADRDLLRAAADRRNAMVHEDGRGSNTSWNRTGDDIVTVLEEVVRGVDPASVPEFDVADVDLGALVEKVPHGFRSPREGQLRSLQNRGLVRVPDRLLGLV